MRKALLKSEADDGDRTRDPQLGKLMLYQLSYVRAAAQVSRIPLLLHARARTFEGLWQAFGKSVLLRGLLRRWCARLALADVPAPAEKGDRMAGFLFRLETVEASRLSRRR